MEVNYKFTLHVFNTSEEECDCTEKGCDKHRLTYLMEPSDMIKIADKKALVMTYSVDVSFKSSDDRKGVTYTPRLNILKKGPRFNASRSENTMLLIVQEIICSTNSNINEFFKRA